MRGRSIGGVRVGNILACEFVRAEVDNKYSILGVFGGDILVQELPARFRMAFYIELFFTRIGPASIAVTASHAGKPFSRIEAEMEASDLTAPATIAFPTLSILIENEGPIELVLEIGGKKHNILKKMVRIGPQKDT
jgi:hypothetical protein